MKLAILFAFTALALSAQVTIVPPSPGSIVATTGNISITIAPDKIPATLFNVKLTVGGAVASYTVAVGDAATFSQSLAGNTVSYSFVPGAAGAGTTVTAGAQIGSGALDKKSVVFP